MISLILYMAGPMLVTYFLLKRYKIKKWKIIKTTDQRYLTRVHLKTQETHLITWSYGLLTMRSCPLKKMLGYTICLEYSYNNKIKQTTAKKVGHLHSMSLKKPGTISGTTGVVKKEHIVQHELIRQNLGLLTTML